MDFVCLFFMVCVWIYEMEDMHHKIKIGVESEPSK